MDERVVLAGDWEAAGVSFEDLMLVASAEDLRLRERVTWVLACSRKASDRVKPKPQLSTGQTNNFSEVCDRMWRAKWPDRVKDLKQLRTGQMCLRAHSADSSACK
jgi:hypothetical protein